MQMSTRYGFAFLCMPKCASTSIEAAIKKFCNINFSGHPTIKHINAQVFSESILAAHQKLVPSSNIESFCLIREPLEWIESWYRFRTRDQLKDPRHPNHKNYTGNISYNDFIKEYISEGKRKSFANLRTQYKFLSLNNGQIGVDHIIPMDRLDLVTNLLSEKLEQKIKIRKKNVSPRVPVPLERGIEEKLRQYLAKDIAVYEFVMNHEKFNKALHSDKLFATLQACR